MGMDVSQTGPMLNVYPPQPIAGMVNAGVQTEVDLMKFDDLGSNCPQKRPTHQLNYIF